MGENELLYGLQINLMFDHGDQGHVLLLSISILGSIVGTIMEEN